VDTFEGQKGHLSKKCQPLHIRVGVGTILPIDKPMDICVPAFQVAKVSLAGPSQFATLIGTIRP
jgi:hypothetical protein